MGCSTIRPSPSNDEFYDIEVNKATMVAALLLGFAFFVTPALMHLTIKFYLKHSLLYKKKLTPKEAEDAKSTQMLKPPSIYLSCKNVTYSVPMNSELLKKTGKSKGSMLDILKDVTAGFHSGTLNAIMGPSGCGKSTLLDILADRKSSGVISGDITLNGYQRDKFFKRSSAYVMQFDSLFPYLSVRETLLFAAEFRMDESVAEKILRVDEVIRQLDLVHATDTMIGCENDPYARGISGGQRRRVTVGIELLSSPSLMFLDEPTTGLDAFDSLKLVTILRKLADKGCTILCTIHQPRTEIFNQFDNLMLMVDGNVAYLGPIHDIPSYLKSVEIPVSADSEENIADFVVDLTYSKPTEHSSSKAVSVSELLVDKYKTSFLKEENQKFVDEIFSRRDSEGGALLNPSEFYHKDLTTYKNSKFSIPYANPIHRQIFTLSRRSSLNASRNISSRINLLVNAVQFLFFGLLWLGPRIGSLRGFVPEFAVPNLEARSISGFLYTMVNVICVFEVDVIAEAHTEKQVFLREHASGAYSVIAYHLFWATKLGWRALRNGLLFSLLSYFFTDLQHSFIQFFTFTVYMCVLSSCGSGIALLLVMAVLDVRGAADIHNSVLGFMGTFAGFFLLPSLIPTFLKYYTYYLSFYHYAYEGLLWNNYSHGVGGFEKSKKFLEEVFNVDCNLDMWSNLLVLLAFPVVFHLIATFVTALSTRSASFWDRQKNKLRKL